MREGLICTASWDHTLRVVDPSSGECLQVFTGHTDKVVHVTQLQDGSMCSSSIDCTIRIWRWQPLQPLLVLRGHTQNARWVVQLDGHRLCSCSKDRTLRVWDISPSLSPSTTSSSSVISEAAPPEEQRQARTEKVVTGHEDYVRCVTLLRDGRLLSGSDDCTMRLWS